ATSRAGSIPGGNVTVAFSVAKFTVAVTPSRRLSFFSIRAAHEAHVMPPIDSSTREMVTLTAYPPGVLENRDNLAGLLQPRGVQPGVDRIPVGEQLPVRSTLDDPAVVDDDHLVGRLRGGQPVRD